ncbi:MAG: alpha-ribazole phosphatase family protein [bacterium]|nr:alpha-ribazole phosphatase family protein [bacterium]
MKLYLIRHTRTATPTGTCYGFLDVQLADSFADELRSLRETMNANELNGPLRIYSSPLQRCRRLAIALATPERTPNISWDDRLKELNFGEWEGRTWDAIQSQDAERSRDWMDHFVSARCPGGESYADLARRVGEFLHDLSAGAADSEADSVRDVTGEIPPTVIVAHGGSLRALLAHALGLDLERGFAFDLDYGRLSCLEWDPALPPGHRGKLLYLNR